MTTKPSLPTAAAPAPTTPDAGRRQLLGAAAAVGVAGALLGAPAIVRAQAAPKVRVGFWPIASGLPFFVAIEKGYFKAEGINVKLERLAGLAPARPGWRPGMLLLHESRNRCSVRARGARRTCSFRHRIRYRIP